MKTRLLTTMILAATLLMSCEKFDDDYALVDSATKDSFNQLFPSAKQTDWDVDVNYFVADFKQGNVEGSAWFTNDGTAVWLMTEWDIRYVDLPQAVRDAFAASEYGQWRVDDVDKVERPDVGVVYVIEAESGENEVVMYFSADGLLLNATLDVEGNNDNTQMIVNPTTSSVVDTAKDFVSTRYVDSRILDVEVDDGCIEIDILDGSIHKEVTFDMNGEWLFTSYDILVRDLPVAITQAISASSYSDYLIDDAEFIEAPSGDYYLVEVEKGEREATLRITATGEII